jgi:hypothetical protein
VPKDPSVQGVCDYERLVDEELAIIKREVLGIALDPHDIASIWETGLLAHARGQGEGPPLLH